MTNPNTDQFDIEDIIRESAAPPRKKGFLQKNRPRRSPRKLPRRK